MRTFLTTVLAAALSVLLGVGPAVADEPIASASKIASDGTPVVNVTLSDMHISLDRTSVPAGVVTFRVTNVGAVTHEFVFLRTSLAADKIPMSIDEPGKASEDTDIAEVQDVSPGHFSGGAITLAAGNYVLICNMPGHYAAGMRTTLTVTPPVVNVSLQDMSIHLDRTSVIAGPVNFLVSNAGSVTHEFVLLRTDLPADMVPANAAQPGKAAEDGDVGEVENVSPGHFSGGLITLDAGKYVLICNQPGHYAAGMRTSFTVLPAPADPDLQLGNDNFDAGGGD